MVHTAISHGKYLLITITVLLTIVVNAQESRSLSYIDSLTVIMQTLDNDSPKQQEVISELEQRLGLHLKSPNLSKAENDTIFKTIRGLTTKTGNYYFLRGQKKDSLNAEVVQLGDKLNKLQDSIDSIKIKLVEVIENPVISNKNKEEATKLLASIHDNEVVDYLINNEAKLRFGEHTFDNMKDDFHRTAIRALREEYAHQAWVLFPYLFQNLTLGQSEIAIFKDYLYKNRPKSPTLLLNYMLNNSVDKSKPLIEFLLIDARKYEETLKRYEQALEKNDHK